MIIAVVTRAEVPAARPRSRRMVAVVMSCVSYVIGC
jgi:hypothetical protein